MSQLPRDLVSAPIRADYAAFARALGGRGERIERPEEIAPAIRRGIELTRAGTPVLLEFITGKETRASSVSRLGTMAYCGAADGCVGNEDPAPAWSLVLGLAYFVRPSLRPGKLPAQGAIG